MGIIGAPINDPEVKEFPDEADEAAEIVEESDATYEAPTVEVVADVDE